MKKHLIRSKLLVLALGGGSLIAVSPSEAQTIANPSFESPVTENFLYLNGQTHGWAFSGHTGVSHSNSGFNGGEAQEGSQYGILQAGYDSASISQGIFFPSGGSYTLSFFQSQRGGSNGSITYAVSLDSIPLSTISITDDSALHPYPFTLVEIDFATTAGNHQLSFDAIAAPHGDDTVFLDNVRIFGAAAVPEVDTARIVGAGFCGVALLRRLFKVRR